MSTADVVNRVNQQVIDLWKHEFAGREAETPCPLIYAELAEMGLVVIGCNPSLPKRGHYACPMMSQIIVDRQSIECIKSLEVAARNGYPYFQPCESIAKTLGLFWAHVDLFFQRGTSQKAIEREACESSIGWDLPITLRKFASEQVKLALQLVEACRPKIVLVANAFAAKIIHSEVKLRNLDAEGLLWATIAWRAVPVFLSGM